MLFKQGFSEWKKLSFYDAIRKVCDYVKEVNEDYKEQAVQDSVFVTKKMMLDAEKYLNKVQDFILHKPLKQNHKHRTLIKKDYGVVCGITTEIMAFPNALTADIELDLYMTSAGK